MNRLLFLFIFTLTILSGHSVKSQLRTQQTPTTKEPTAPENIAYQWGHLALLATANDTEKFLPRPTITSRYLALIFVAVFFVIFRCIVVIGIHPILQCFQNL